MDNILNREENHDLFIHIALAVTISLMVAWSAIDAIDYFAWFMLTIPSVIMIISLSLTYKKFQFSTLTYVMVALHIIVLLYGAKYRYSGNPLGLEIKDMFNLSRNYFDRVGHFMQGFAPMFMVKEFMLRKGYMKRSKFFYLIIMSFILAISAAWELSEFFAVLITKKPASYILSSQGVLWDSQWDMILAIIGGACALIIFGKFHDKKINEFKLKDQLDDIKVKL